MSIAYLESKHKLGRLPSFEIWSFDTETDIRGFFKLVSVGRIMKTNDSKVPFLFEVKTFFSFEEFVFFLFKRNIKCLYCYNISFDSRFIPNFLISNPNFDFQLVESSSQLLGVILSKFNKQKVVIKDFFPYCLTSLDSISKKLQCKSKKYPDFKEKDRDKLKALWNSFFKNCSMKELQKHCEEDVKILCELIYRYRRHSFELFNLDMCSRRIFSLASLAMVNFRTNYIKSKIPNSFLEKDFVEKGKYRYRLLNSREKFVRDSYHGGYTGNRDNLRHLQLESFDINSSYPYQTQDEKFPIGASEWVDRLSEFIHNTEEIAGFALVKVNFNNKKYFLPVHREDNKFGKQDGYWEGVLTSHELNWLTNHKISWEFQKGLTFEDWDKTHSLEKYCKELYVNKSLEAQDSPLRDIYKLYLNSLTGKFGQKTEIETKKELRFLSNQEFEDLDKPETLNQRINDNIWLTWKKEIKSTLKPYQFVSWISLITAKGRIQLTDMIIKTNAFYWDTDSVYSSAKMCKDLVSDEKTLGGWKREHKIGRFRALAPKMYCFYDLEEKKHFVKCKGVPKDFFNKEMFDKIWNFKDGGNISVENIPRFLSMKEAFHRVNVLEKDLLVMYDEMDKTLTPKCKM